MIKTFVFLFILVICQTIVCKTIEKRDTEGHHKGHEAHEEVDKMVKAQLPDHHGHKEEEEDKMVKAAPDDAEPDVATAPSDGETTPATEGETTAAPTEGETTAAPPEGEAVTTAAAEGGEAGAETTPATEEEEEDNCGLRKVSAVAKPKKKVLGAKGMGRIVGGVDAEPAEFPWQISLQIFIPKKKKVEHFCGGAIIDRHWILTAAHCLDILKGKEKNLIVKMGSNKMKDSNTPDYHVDRFILHDGWDRKTQSNDVAVVRVKERIEYKTNEKHQFVVNKVCLPAKGFELKTGTATLSGFGQTGATAGQAEYLQKLDVPIYDQNQCAVNYKKYVKINEMKICAGGKGGQDSCMGDSGGPLVHLDTTTNKNSIIGVVSFGYPCAVKDMPGVYTKVAKYVDWIRNNAKD